MRFVFVSCMIPMLRLNLLSDKKKDESMAARQGPLHEKSRALRQGPCCTVFPARIVAGPKAI